MTDFAETPVPESARISIVRILAVWMGFVVVVGAMATGGVLASSISFNEILLVVLLGNLVLGGFAALGGYVGAASGKSFALLLGDVFSPRVAAIVNLYVPVVLTFWFAVISSLMAGYLANILGIDGSGKLAVSVTVVVVFACSAYFGMRFLSTFSMIIVPIIIVIGSWAVLKDAIPVGTPTESISDPTVLNRVLGLVLSTWIMGALVNIQDITRYSKTAASGALVGILGVVLGNSFNLIVGARAALMTGQHDPSQLLVAIGAAPLAFILIVGNFWTTCDNNMYSASLGASRGLNLRRRSAVVILVAIAGGIAIFEPVQWSVIVSGIIFMGNTAPALGAIVIARYFTANKWHQPPDWVGLISWVVGSACSFYISGAIGIVLGFAVATVCFVILEKATDKKELVY